MPGLSQTFGGPVALSYSKYSTRRLIYIVTRYHGGYGVRIGGFDGRRYKTTEAGDEKTGHINAGPNEGILFLDSQVPP